MYTSSIPAENLQVKYRYVPPCNLLEAMVIAAVHVRLQPLRSHWRLLDSCSRPACHSRDGSVISCWPILLLAIAQLTVHLANLRSISPLFSA